MGVDRAVFRWEFLSWAIEELSCLDAVEVVCESIEPYP